MEPDPAEAWNGEARLGGRLERIREGDAGQFVALAFEARLFRQLLVTALPGGLRRVEQALQGMTGNPELEAVLRQQIMKGFAGVENW